MTDLRQTFEITHPFHPARGRVWNMVDSRPYGGEVFLYFYDDEEVLTSVREGWTSLGSPDPFVVLAAGRECFCLQDLVRLTRLVHDIREGASGLQGDLA